MKHAAEARGLRVYTPTRLKPFADEARAAGAEAFVVASYGKIVPQTLLDAVPIAFNVHPSLLPLYRGATPLQSAIRDGRLETGVTIIAMDAGMDTGEVLLQEPQSAVARELGFSEEEVAATATRPLRKGDLMIDWSQPARRIVDTVRSLSPAPAARTEGAGERLKVLRAHVAADEEVAGTFCCAGDGRMVVLDLVVPPGRAPMPGDVYARAAHQRNP